MEAEPLRQGEEGPRVAGAGHHDVSAAYASGGAEEGLEALEAEGVGAEQDQGRVSAGPGSASQRPAGLAALFASRGAEVIGDAVGDDSDLGWVEAEVALEVLADAP